MDSINGNYFSLYGVSAVTNTVPLENDSMIEKKTARGSKRLKEDSMEFSPQARAAMKQPGMLVAVGGKSSSQNGERQNKTVSTIASDFIFSGAVSLANLPETQLNMLVTQGVISEEKKQRELNRRVELDHKDQFQKLYKSLFKRLGSADESEIFPGIFMNVLA